jgi:hypothetical protein
VLPWSRQGLGADEGAQRTRERAKLLAQFGIKVTQ